MKRKISLILVLAMVCAMLSGCMAEEIKISFEKDGSGTIEVGLYYSEEFYESMNTTPEEMISSDDGEVKIVSKTFNGEKYHGVSESEEFTSPTNLYYMMYDGTSTALDISETINNGKRYISISGLVPSDETIINSTGEDVSQISTEDISNILIATLDIEFPDGVTTVYGIDKEAYRINGNTIHVDLVSESTSQTFVITGCIGDVPENYGLENFKKANVYVVNNNTGKFKDVPVDAWYANDVARMYEYEIVAGTSDTTFDPKSNLSLAQIITMASRAHAIYSGYSSEVFVTGNEEDEWFTPFVMYAYVNGIIEQGIFNETGDLSVLKREATRAEMAYVIARCLPESEYKVAREFAGFDDVVDSKYAEYINRLGTCGIAAGIGNNKFNPNGILTRAEAVVFMSRMLQHIPE